MKLKPLFLIPLAIACISLSARAEDTPPPKEQTTIGVSGFVYVAPKPPLPGGGSNRPNGGARPPHNNGNSNPSRYPRPYTVSYGSVKSPSADYTLVPPTANPQTGADTDAAPAILTSLAAPLLLAGALLRRKEKGERP